ncbi:hypothetical protein RQN30_10620 [Arcanobacterium hippocoleae]
MVPAIAGGGYVILRAVEAGGKIIYKKVKKVRADNKAKIKGYTVVNDGTDEQGLVFKTGDKIRVLESADDAILIEKVGDKNNPYFVSVDFLKTIIAYGE